MLRQLCWVWFLLTACWGSDDLDQAQLALENHDLATAELGFRATLNRAPQSTKAMEGLGWTYHLSGQREAAIAAFDNCLVVEPTRAGCLRGRASTALAIGDIPKARKLLDRAVEAAPGDPEVDSSLAIFRLAEGRIDEALELYKSLSRRFPEKASYVVGYAEALLRSDQPAVARAEIERALQQQNIPVRHQAMLWLLRARALTLQSGSVIDFDCTNSSAIESISRWIFEAQRSIEQASLTGVKIPETAVLARQIERRQRIVIEHCPEVAQALAALSAAGQ